MILTENLERPVATIVLRERTLGYRRWRAIEYRNKKVRLTARQSLFYRNLIQLAHLLNSNELPVDFETPEQGSLFMDHGYIKIAVHAGFLMPLRDDPNGVVSSVTLTWDATGRREVDQ